MCFELPAVAQWEQLTDRAECHTQALIPVLLLKKVLSQVLLNHPGLVLALPGSGMSAS